MGKAGDGTGLGMVEVSKLTPREVPPPTKLYLLILSRQFHKLRSKYSNMRLWGSFSSKTLQF